jgi:hypothetical protein
MAPVMLMKTELFLIGLATFECQMTSVGLWLGILI